MLLSAARRAEKKHVVVVGAGLVGLTSAEALLRRGFRVTVVDRQKRVASECSFGNAALLMRSYSRPKTATPLQLLRWATTRSEPVHVSWRALLDPQMTSFGARFMLSGPQTSAKVMETTRVTDSLCSLSRESFDAIMTEYGLPTRTLSRGLLMYFRDGRKLDAVVQEARESLQPELHEELFQVVSPRECVELEPSLAGQEAALSGGLFWKKDLTVCPLSFSTGLADKLESLGAEFRLGEEVLGVDATEGGVALRTSAGELGAGALVLAAGVWSGRLAKAWGLPGAPPLPLYGMRGHSMTFDVSHLQEGKAPSRSVCDGDAMAFFSPLPEGPEGPRRLRAAAFGDFDGWGYGPAGARPWRLEQLRGASERNFPGLVPPAAAASLGRPAAPTSALEGLCPEADAATRWCGLRPMSPDGLPVVGRLTASGPVYVNAGHGALGWTLSPGCAELLASAVAQELRGDAPRDCGLLGHLDPQRFRWARVLRSARRMWLGEPAPTAPQGAS